MPKGPYIWHRHRSKGSDDMQGGRSSEPAPYLMQPPRLHAGDSTPIVFAATQVKWDRKGPLFRSVRSLDSERYHSVVARRPPADHHWPLGVALFEGGDHPTQLWEILLPKCEARDNSGELRQRSGLHVGASAPAFPLPADRLVQTSPLGRDSHQALTCPLQ
jgi:hypothetical protein